MQGFCGLFSLDLVLGPDPKIKFFDAGLPLFGGFGGIDGHGGGGLEEMRVGDEGIDLHRGLHVSELLTVAMPCAGEFVVVMCHSLVLLFFTMYFCPFLT